MKGYCFLSIILFFLFASCDEKRPVSVAAQLFLDSIDGKEKTILPDGKIKDTLVHSETLGKLELQLINAGLKNVGEMDSTIKIDLRYSTSNNFIGLDVYGNFDQCYLQPDVAQKLVNAQKFLKEKFPYYSLIVFDAVRPLHIQQKMWDTLVLPPGQKTKYLSNPNNGSLHNYGAAVDLSIIDDHGIPLDMGTDFDFFGDKAHPEKEKELLESGELSERQVLNREILRDVMHRAGFFGIQTEWWHFNSCTRVVAAQTYKIIE